MFFACLYYSCNSLLHDSFTQFSMTRILYFPVRTPALAESFKWNRVWDYHVKGLHGQFGAVVALYVIGFILTIVDWQIS